MPPTLPPTTTLQDLVDDPTCATECTREAIANYLLRHHNGRPSRLAQLCRSDPALAGSLALMLKGVR